MGSREGTTDFNATSRWKLGWIEAAAVLEDTGILKPLNVEATVTSPFLVLKQECAECWSKNVTSTNNQDKADAVGTNAADGGARLWTEVIFAGVAWGQRRDPFLCGGLCGDL